MMYWEEFQTKFGFNDGDSIPPDVEEKRAVYLNVVNILAEKYGSSVRYYPYDRPGMHNYYLVLLRDANVSEEEAKSNNYEGPKDTDEAMDTAIREAYEYGLDDLVYSKVEIDTEGLEKLIALLKEP